MRIVYLHQYFNTPSMAGGLRSYEMAKRLVGRGHEVHVITSIRDVLNQGNGWVVTNEDGIQVHWINVPYANTMGLIARVVAFIRFAVHSSIYATRLKGDVVFATSTPLSIGFPGLLVSRFNRIPLVFEVRDLWPEVPIAMGVLKSPLIIWAARVFERFIYRHSRAIIALSPGMKAGILKGGIPDTKVRVVPNVSDLNRFKVPVDCGMAFRRKHDWLQDKPLVVYVGTFGRINGLSYMVRLAAAIGNLNSEVRFLAVGSGIEESEIRSLATDLGVLEKNFFMLDRIPKGEIAEVLSAATVASSFVVDVPETWANSANKFFDALAAGKPVIINHEGWLADLLRESGAGIVLSANNVDRSAIDLLRFIEDGDGVIQAGKNALKLAESRFNIEDLANDLADILEEVAKGP